MSRFSQPSFGLEDLVVLEEKIKIISNNNHIKKLYDEVKEELSKEYSSKEKVSLKDARIEIDCLCACIKTEQKGTLQNYELN